MDDGFAAVLVLFLMVVAGLIGLAVGSARGELSGTVATLSTLRPCAKDSPLVKQTIGPSVFVCVDGEWRLQQ